MWHTKYLAWRFVTPVFPRRMIPGSAHAECCGCKISICQSTTPFCFAEAAAILFRRPNGKSKTSRKKFKVPHDSYKNSFVATSQLFVRQLASWAISRVPGFKAFMPSAAHLGTKENIYVGKETHAKSLMHWQRPNCFCPVQSADGKRPFAIQSNNAQIKIWKNSSKVCPTSKFSNTLDEKTC